MTNQQLVLLLLNESLFFSGQKMFVMELVPENERIDPLAFCVGPEIIIAIPFPMDHVQKLQTLTYSVFILWGTNWK